jgi:hypothetical protein
MKKLVLLAAAAALLTPALISSASAETLNVRVGIGNSGYNSGYNNGYRSYGQERVYVDHRRHCRMVVTRHHRANGTVVIRKIRKCN